MKIKPWAKHMGQKFDDIGSILGNTLRTTKIFPKPPNQKINKN
jgi:hypothetical protein